MFILREAQENTQRYSTQIHNILDQLRTEDNFYYTQNLLSNKKLEPNQRWKYRQLERSYIQIPKKLEKVLGVVNHKTVKTKYTMKYLPTHLQGRLSSPK